MAGNTDDDLSTEHGVQIVARWEWTSRSDAGRWSRSQQGIKPPRAFIPKNDGFAPQDDGQDIWFSKLKIRGGGRALVIRYESETGKDFQIWGWSIPFTGDTQV